jgi:hypothetical protein
MRFPSVLLAACITFSFGPAVLACSCPRPSLPREQFASAATVFEGDVLRIGDRWNVFRKAWTYLLLLTDRQPDEKSYGFEIEFEVTRTWRGPATSKMRVFTGRGGGDCGYPFTVGQRYLVYAYGNPRDGWYTGICSRTRVAANAAEDFAYLNGLRELPLRR